MAIPRTTEESMIEVDGVIKNVKNKELFSGRYFDLIEWLSKTSLRSDPFSSLFRKGSNFNNQKFSNLSKKKVGRKSLRDLRPRILEEDMKLEN